jgi:predicted ArsR family transcriptional regulator
LILIEEYIKHRQDREDKIIQLLKHKDYTSKELVNEIYVGYPADILDTAEKVQLLHLQKLLNEGIIEIKDSKFSWVGK